MAETSPENGDVEALEENTDEIRKSKEGRDTGRAGVAMGEYKAGILARSRQLDTNPGDAK
jgi:hypothetical protein